MQGPPEETRTPELGSVEARSEEVERAQTLRYFCTNWSILCQTSGSERCPALSAANMLVRAVQGVPADGPPDP